MFWKAFREEVLCVCCASSLGFCKHSLTKINSNASLFVFASPEATDLSFLIDETQTVSGERLCRWFVPSISLTGNKYI